MNRNKSEIALIARGITTEKAKEISRQGWTLSKIKTANAASLAALQLPDDVLANIRNSARPPIPSEILIKALFLNRWVCCICRDQGRAVVVHHINPWAESRDHSISNLAVLCTQHHGEAHTTRHLEVTLTPSRLRSIKQEWEAEAARLDSVAIQQATQLQSDDWMYFNHLRLAELSISNGIDLTRLPGYEPTFHSGACDADGRVIQTSDPQSFMYAGLNRTQLYWYMKEMLYALPDRAFLRNISNDLDRGLLRSVVIAGDLVYLQGSHIFSDVRAPSSDVQLVTGCRSANKVEVTFVFDRREATSTSAWTSWLRGTHAVGSLIQVKNVERTGDHLHISGTVIAMRTALQELKTRTYESGLYRSGLLGAQATDDELDEEN